MGYLTLNDQPLLYDHNRAIETFLRKYQPLDELFAMPSESIQRQNTRDSSFGISTIGLTHPNYPSPPRLSVNQLYWPTGAARWARGLFIASQEVATTLAESCGTAMYLRGSVDNVIDSSTMTISAKVYCLPPRPISCNDESSDNAYLIPVVDQRYWWQFADIGDYGKEDITTWAALFNQVSSRLGVAISYDSIAAAYVKPDPDEFTRRYDNCATILDAVAHSVGQRIVTQFNGDVRSISWDESNDELFNNTQSRTPWWQIAGGDIEQKPQPSKVTVAFPRLDCFVPSCSRKYYAKTINAPSSYCTTQSTVKTVHSTAWANYIGSSSTPDNYIELDSLAGKIADDFYYSSSKMYDRTFVGIKSWYFTGFDDHALVSFGTEDTEAIDSDFATSATSGAFDKQAMEDGISSTYQRGYFTRVQSAPYSFGSEQLLHSGTVRPKVPEGLLGAELKDDQCLNPGSSALAYLLKWNSDSSSWEKDTTCTVLIWDPFYRNFLVGGERVWVRRSCENSRLECVGENGLLRRAQAYDSIACGAQGFATVFSNKSDNITCTPNPQICSMYVCNSWGCKTGIEAGQEIFIRFFERVWQVLPTGSGASSLIRFEMQSKLTLGGYGTAIEVGTSAPHTRKGATFPIKDHFQNPGMFRYDPPAVVSPYLRGYMGWCIIPDDAEIKNGKPVREIVWMEQIARSITFKVKEDWNSSTTDSVKADLLTYYLQGKDPLETDLKQPDGSIYVFDTTNNYPRVLKDAIGKARYNDQWHRYEVVECNQMATLMLGTLEEDVCSISTYCFVTDYEPMTFAQYGQKPTNIYLVSNPFRLAGKAGYNVLIGWNESSEEWTLLQVQHREVKVLTSIEQTTCGMTSKKQKIVVMQCDDSEEDGGGLTLYPVDVIDSFYVDGCEIKAYYKTLCASLTDPGSATTHNTTVATFYPVDFVDGFATVSPSSSAPTDCKIYATTKTLCMSLTDPDAADAGDDILVASFTPTLIVQDVYQDGLCIDGLVALAYVLCTSDEESVEFLCGTECVTPSGG